MVTIEAYFDESGTHKGAPILCVGGYLFEQEKAVRLDAEWRDMLETCGVPFFHMAACEAGAYPFHQTPSEVREAVAGRAVRIIQKYMTYGIVLAVNEEQFKSVIPRHPMIGSAYSWLTNQMIAAVRRWEIEADYDGKVTYIFESGAPHQGEANTIIDTAALNEADSLRSSYAGHGFRKKEDTPALQAADVLVWHYYNDFERKQAGELSRDRYVELIDDQYWHFVWDKAGLEEQAETIRELSQRYPLAGA